MLVVRIGELEAKPEATPFDRVVLGASLVREEEHALLQFPLHGIRAAFFLNA